MTNRHHVLTTRLCIHTVFNKKSTDNDQCLSRSSPDEVNAIMYDTENLFTTLRGE